MPEYILIHFIFCTEADMKKRGICLRGVVVFLFGCALFALFTLSGCTTRYDNARVLFEDFCDIYGTLPAGKLYTSASCEWEDGYLPDEIVYSMYTDERGECYYDLVIDSAIYLCSSQDEFCELAVLVCRDNTDTQAVAKMCRIRMDSVLRLRGLVDTENAENAQIQIFGNVVIMSALPDTEKAQKALRALSK